MRRACAALAAAFIAFAPGAAVWAKPSSAKPPKVEFNSRADGDRVDRQLSPQARARARAGGRAGAEQGRRAARSRDRGLLRRLRRRRARRQSDARRSAWSARCCRCRRRPVARGARHRLFRPAGMEEPAGAHSPTSMPTRRAMIDDYLTGKLPTLDAIELDKSPTLLEKVGEHFGVKPKDAEAVLRPQSRAARHAVGPSISPPASTGRSGASSRCCRGRRSATTSSGSTVGSVGQVHARQQRRALSRRSGADQGHGALPGGRRCGRSSNEVIRAAETTQTAQHPQGAARRDRQAQDARDRATSAT